MAEILVSMTLAVAALAYACWLHIYYQNRIIPRSEVEKLKFREYMRALGVEETEVETMLSSCTFTANLIQTNRKLKKLVKKYKL